MTSGGAFPAGIWLLEAGSPALPLARSSSLAEGEPFAAGSWGFSGQEGSCVSLGVRVCVRVCVRACAWRGLEVAVQQPGPNGSLDPAEGWGSSDRPAEASAARGGARAGWICCRRSQQLWCCPGAPRSDAGFRRGREALGAPGSLPAAQPRLCAGHRDLRAPPAAPQTLGFPAPRSPPRWHRLAKRSVVTKPGPPEEMEVFSLILVVSVCWTRTWKAAIADSIIHIGKRVLRLLVLLDTFPALLCNLLSSARLPPFPPAAPLPFIPCSLALVCLFVPLL